MERVYHITQAAVGPVPDSFFWYTLCVLLSAFSIWAVKRHIDANKDTDNRHGDLITQMGKCIIELTTMTKIHEVKMEAQGTKIAEMAKRVEKHEEEIEELRDFYIVSNKK